MALEPVVDSDVNATSMPTTAGTIWSLVGETDTLCHSQNRRYSKSHYCYISVQNFIQINTDECMF